MSPVSSMSSRQRWALALKPASWPKLLVPMLLGQAIGIDATGEVHLVGLLFGVLFTALDTVFVVLLNDWGDQEVDRIKRAMFPTSSLKVIPDGVLGSRMLLGVGVAAGLGALCVAALVEGGASRPGLSAMALLCLGMFWAYSLPPLRLNYRGGGELLEAAGVGVALPWINAYAQSGQLTAPGLVVLPGFALLAASSAVASGLSDERSDRRGGKRTFTTMLGNTLARRLVDGSVVAGVAVWALTTWLGAYGTPTIPLLAATVAAALSVRSVLVAGRGAVTDAFDAQRHYKSALHRLVWESTGLLALAMALGPFVGF